MRTPEGADNVAMCHDQQSKGTPADMRIAFEHYLAAAEGSIAQAQFAVSEMYYRGEGTDKRQPEKAVYWYRKAAEQEYVKAIADLAKMHWRGDGLPVRKENAIAAYFLLKNAQVKAVQTGEDKAEMEQKYHLSEMIAQLENKMPPDVRKNIPKLEQELADKPTKDLTD